MKQIKEMRQQIDKIDKNLIKLLERRFELIKKIKSIKKKKIIKIQDKKRENEIIDKLNTSKLDKKFIKEVYKTIFRYSKKIQKKD